jgi:Recombination endonuclease VII
MLTEKACSSCSKVKPLHEYHRFANARDGHRAECKTCALQRARAHYQRTYRPIHPRGLITAVCAHCATEFSYTRTTGRMRIYCGDLCKYTAGEKAKKARATTTLRTCACGSTAVARVGKPVCAACKVDRRDPVRAAARERRRTLRKYGITESDWDRLLASQGGLCAICRTDVPGGRGESWHIDHCHTTNQVRGLLCHSCNVGLGSFHDDPERLSSAIAYLAGAMTVASSLQLRSD